MLRYSPFSLLSLAVLHAHKDNTLSRYELMSSVNEKLQILLPPASPGAAYPALKKLASLKLIDFDHDKVKINQSGSESLRAALVASPPPVALTDIIACMLAAHESKDKPLQQEWQKKLGLILIKNERRGDASAQNKDTAASVWCSNTGVFLQRVSLDLSALK